MEDTQVGTEGKKSNDPVEVARQGFDALMNGGAEGFAASLSTKAAGTLGRFMPHTLKASQHAKMARHGRAK